MLILGAIDFSAALARIADDMGYRVTIADPREAFLCSERFSAWATTMAAWPQDVVAQLAPGPRDAVLVFSHDPEFDVPALLAALATQAGYIGALGSRQTTADRDRRLRDAGAGDEDLERLHAPPVWTSGPPPWRRPRSRCWPRSRHSGQVAPACRCATRRGRSGPLPPTPPSWKTPAWSGKRRKPSSVAV